MIEPLPDYLVTSGLARKINEIVAVLNDHVGAHAHAVRCEVRQMFSESPSVLVNLNGGQNVDK